MPSSEFVLLGAQGVIATLYKNLGKLDASRIHLTIALLSSRPTSPTAWLAQCFDRSKACIHTTRAPLTVGSR